MISPSRFSLVDGFSLFNVKIYLNQLPSKNVVLYPGFGHDVHYGESDGGDQGGQQGVICLRDLFKTCLQYNLGG